MERRTALQVMASVIAGALVSENARAIFPPRTVSPEEFGAAGAGGDDQEGLERALSFCKENNTQLSLGPKRYLHSGDLTVDGVDVVGHSQVSELRATSDKRTSLILTGKGASLRRIMKSSSGPKTRTGGLDGVKVLGAHNFTIENVIVENTAATGIFISRSNFGRVSNVLVQNTLADGVHLTGCTENVVLTNVVARSTGDDGIAVVSYRKDNGVCQGIIINHCTSLNSKARGMSIVGGIDVHIRRPVIESSACAGLYLFGEDAYDTYGVSGCSVDQGEVMGCVTNSTVGHACVMLGGRSGADVVGGKPITRGAANCVITGVRVEQPANGSFGGISCRENAMHCEVSQCQIARYSTNGDFHYQPVTSKDMTNLLLHNTLL